jgi:tetratricopeptide (TPR) repeat protein
VRCDTSQDNITALRIEWSRYLAAWEQSGRKDADALLNLGNAYKILGRADESLKCFMLALRLQPMRLDIWILGVSVYAELGRLDDAAATFRAVLDAIPASVPRISEIVSIYSILLTNLANCSEAVARLRAQPRDQQSDLVADLIMCQAQRVCGDFDAAAQTSTSLRQRLSNGLQYQRLSARSTVSISWPFPHFQCSATKLLSRCSSKKSQTPMSGSRKVCSLPSC